MTWQVTEEELQRFRKEQSALEEHAVQVSCAWAILCTNRRLGAPRDLFVAGEASFAGQIRRGIANDALDVTWKAQRCLILGHGPYATENARTALEHGAADVSFAVRRHGCARSQALWDFSLVFVSANASAKSELVRLSLVSQYRVPGAGRLCQLHS